MKILTITKNDAGQRLDKFLSKAVPAMPKSLLYKSVRTKKIKVNRKRTEQGYILAEGDTVQLFLNDDLFAKDAEKEAFRTLKPRLKIIYEDENVLICNKPAGMIVHPDEGETVNTLIGHICAYLYQSGAYDPDAEQSFAPALANRIDRNTSGLVIAAKNAASLRELNRMVKDRTIKKEYLCAVHGIPEKKEATLTGYLTKDADANLVTVYREPPANVRKSDLKTIVTKYRVLASANDLSLLRVDLVTGRTHQIRAHLASIGHPLLGDGKYGVNREDKKMGYAFQALTAYSLTFGGGGETLSYLDGKVFTVDPKEIWFLSEFGEVSLT